MADKIFSIDAEELMARPMEKTPFIVDGLLPYGLTCLSGDSKIGKSWMMLWLGLQVATGKPVWDFQTNACDVLYLCLEDNFRRIQTRLFKLADEAPDNLRFAVSAEDICHGLDEQIADYLSQYPATKLIIIDTLQKVRDSKSGAGKNSMYSSDYDDMSAFKEIADKNNLAVVLVHHLRKQFDAKDPFNNASGSTGLNGASDTMYILRKDSRASDLATLTVTGRDILDQELRLKKNDCLWQLIEHKDAETIKQEAIPDFIHRLVAFMEQRTEWTGTATELVEQLDETDVTANAVTKYISRYYADALLPAGIVFKSKRTGKCRILMFKRSDGCDGNDGFSVTR